MIKEASNAEQSIKYRDHFADPLPSQEARQTLSHWACLNWEIALSSMKKSPTPSLSVH